MSEERKKAADGNVFRAVISKTQLPCDLLEGEFRLEMRGRRELYICGCRRILKYSEQEMVIRARAFDVFVEGERLVCASYHYSGITINGLVKNIRLEGFE